MKIAIVGLCVLLGGCYGYAYPPPYTPQVVYQVSPPNPYYQAHINAEAAHRRWGY